MSNLSIKIIENPDEILKYLQIGTAIPIWSDFHVFIKSDLNHFKAKSFLLTENGNPAGHALIYPVGETCLYFGYFSALNDNEENIEFLIKKLINYAKSNNYNTIRGPINIPTIIYGWGFMENGSLETIFVGKPVNSPKYIKLFLKNDFFVDIKELALEGSIPKLSKKVEKYDFSDYELFHPKDWDHFMELKDVFLTLNIRNMPSDSVITPDHINVFKNYLNFVIKYGECFMFNFVRYKKTNEIIACMAGVPNPFRKNENGNYDSFNYFTFAIDKEHRRKGLGWLISKYVFDHAYKKGVTYFSSPVGSKQKVLNLMASKVSVSSLRTHIILKYKT